MFWRKRLPLQYPPKCSWNHQWQGCTLTLASVWWCFGSLCNKFKSIQSNLPHTHKKKTIKTHIIKYQHRSITLPSKVINMNHGNEICAISKYGNLWFLHQPWHLKTQKKRKFKTTTNDGCKKNDYDNTRFKEVVKDILSHSILKSSSYNVTFEHRRFLKNEIHGNVFYS